jgi:hypothetical protein
MNKQEIEQLSNMKIRKGFDKLLTKTINYFKFSDDLTKAQAISVIMFINSSNSTSSESYWVLRTDLTKEEWQEKINFHREGFIKSTYKFTNRRTVQKKFQKENFSRGYSGYVSINNKDFYCRSKLECFWLLYLHKKYNNSKYRIEIEEKIFYLDGIASYKPDVFLYENDILVQIFEIKDKQENISDKYELYKNYFNSININFSILLNSDKKILENQNPELKNEVKHWIDTNAHTQKDMRGKNNPRYGAVVTQETKDKIGKSMKTRFENLEFKTKFIESMNKHYQNKKKIQNENNKN